jgi:hypothetical protein
MKTLMSGSRLPLWFAVGYFILRAPARMARMDLPVFLAWAAAQPREAADFARVSRIYRRWLRQPGLRSRNTCYLRSLLLFRFVNPQNGDLCLHFGVDEQTPTETRQHGHAWISLDGIPWNPPHSFAEGRLREIYRFSTLTGGASTAGATAAVAMIQCDESDLANEPPDLV